MLFPVISSPAPNKNTSPAQTATGSRYRKETSIVLTDIDALYSVQTGESPFCPFFASSTSRENQAAALGLDLEHDRTNSRAVSIHRRMASCALASAASLRGCRARNNRANPKSFSDEGLILVTPVDDDFLVDLFILDILVSISQENRALHLLHLVGLRVIAVALEVNSLLHSRFVKEMMTSVHSSFKVEAF